MSERQTGESAGRRARLRAAVALVVFVFVALLLVLYPPDNLYLWIKALHIIAVISWMAGLLYLPRLFVYHTDAPVGSQQSETFKVMERRLFGTIMRPAMGLTWLLGLYLAWSVYGFQGGWLHAKLLLVFLLTGVNEYYGRAVRAFAEDRNKKTGRQWRIWNEAPALLMVLIVVMAVVKPF
ncbi:protoporphyrinogen oxidase HemJ [Shinella curvata]|uniref:Protoporphyrinogen IX oxidase n=1 Tax=Shinella curvata TaxID=1817964 RepID=A0ABT8XKW5_9HYPH|nr:protoporphyrinogen oxidase HemJ [Shinella curvata]MCJ8056494.1 protoporphyrinogen oxidase HemJ [Shinella curvata]MDO6124372.1 protoporphyrinogen oxidase HemJ [Shinella curvata]